MGRRHLHCSADERQEVLHFLRLHGPYTGMPTLSGQFPDVPLAELRDLLGVYRHLWDALHPRERNHLIWHRAGTVWAMDFSEPRHAIDGTLGYLLAVRDLASGLQLAWRPLASPDAASVVAELQLLFTIHGAPLVLKSDNGSPFFAGVTQALLASWKVWALYSPPGQPRYNGSIEASIGSLKNRTDHMAYRADHVGIWTTADVELALENANRFARPRGRHGLTPEQAWALRRPPTLSERETFGAKVRHLEAQARTRDRIALDADLDHYKQAAIHRRVLQQVLVESELLTITRRRIPQTFYGQKVANIR